MKLLMIFTVLNIIARLVFTSTHYGGTLSRNGYIADWIQVYVKVDGRAVAFDVLVPIAYTLALAGGVLWIRQRNETLGTAVMVAVLIGVGILNLINRTVPNANWIAAGILGLLLGRVPLGALDNTLLSLRWRMVGLMFLGYGLVVQANNDTLVVNSP